MTLRQSNSVRMAQLKFTPFAPQAHGRATTAPAREVPGASRGRTG